MAAVVLGVSTGSTANASSYATAAFTPAASDLLVVFVKADSTVAAGSCTDDQSGTYTKIISAVSGGSTCYAFVRTALVPSAASTIVTFDCTGDAAARAVVTVLRVSGLTKTGATAVRQQAIQENQADLSTPAPAFAASALTDNPTVGAVGNGTDPATLTPPTDWTERADTGAGGEGCGLETVSRDSGFTGTTITWGSTSPSSYADIILELDAFVPFCGQGYPDRADLQRPAMIASGVMPGPVMV